MLVMVTLGRVNPVLVYITTGAVDQHIIAVHSSTHDRDCPIYYSSIQEYFTMWTGS